MDKKGLIESQLGKIIFLLLTLLALLLLINIFSGDLSGLTDNIEDLFKFGV